MPALAALLAWVARYGLVILAEKAGSLLVKMLLAYNVSLVAYKFAVGPVVSYMLGALSGVPQTAIDALRGVGFDQAVTIILSAHVMAAAMRIRLKRNQGSTP